VNSPVSYSVFNGIYSSQVLAWRQVIEVFDEDDGPRALAFLPEGRCEALADDTWVVRLRLSELQLRRPRQRGAAGWQGNCGAN